MLKCIPDITMFIDSIYVSVRVFEFHKWQVFDTQNTHTHKGGMWEECDDSLSVTLLSDLSSPWHQPTSYTITLVPLRSPERLKRLWQVWQLNFVATPCPPNDVFCDVACLSCHLCNRFLFKASTHLFFPFFHGKVHTISSYLEPYDTISVWCLTIWCPCALYPSTSF